MKDDLPQPIVPKDPVKIGQTKDGQPVWMEPKDLIPTKDEEQELKSNILTGREQGIVQGNCITTQVTYSLNEVYVQTLPGLLCIIES